MPASTLQHVLNLTWAKQEGSDDGVDWEDASDGLPKTPAADGAAADGGADSWLDIDLDELRGAEDQEVLTRLITFLSTWSAVWRAIKPEPRSISWVMCFSSACSIAVSAR